MKTVFFSNDRTEIERLGKQLMDLSIPCEVRCGENTTTAFDVELCVQKDEDLPRAFMECVRSGIGFAKRKSQPAEKEPRHLFTTAHAELVLVAQEACQ